VIAPFVAARGNRNESPLLREALPQFTRIARAVGLDLRGTVVSLDGAYDCRLNRKAIFNRDTVPNISPNSRGSKRPKRGRKPRFDPATFEERFRTIERLFAWEDKELSKNNFYSFARDLMDDFADGTDAAGDSV
jgi:hypothetical protein